MKPKLLLAGILLCLCAAGTAQNNGIRLKTNFLITQEPVFQLAFEHMTDSSACSWSINVDAGRFQNTEKELFFSSIDYYAVTGYGVMPECRYYLTHSKTGEHFGFFTSIFAHIHRFKATHQEGVNYEIGGYVIDDPKIAFSRFTDLKYGAGGGYRSSCVAEMLYLEIVGGWYFGNHVFDRSGYIAPNRDSRGSAADQLRFELNLVFLF